MIFIVLAAPGAKSMNCLWNSFCSERIHTRTNWEGITLRMSPQVTVILSPSKASAKSGGELGAGVLIAGDSRVAVAPTPGGEMMVCLDADYYAKTVAGVPDEYSHWHNYRIHTPQVT